MKPLLYLLSVLTCFCATSGYNYKINNGRIASISDFKYVVGIKLETLLSEYYCVGGIIHEKYILTAAHCISKQKDKNPTGGYYNVYKKFKVYVYANTDSMKRISRDAIKRKATDVYFTKNYFENGIDDIAILKLDRSLDLGKDIQKLELPSLNSKNQFDSYYNQFAVVAGFGDDPEGDKKMHKSLKKMNMKVSSYVDCYRIYTPDIPVSSAKHMCGRVVELVDKAGEITNETPNSPLGSCHGDSGAPVVYNKNIVIGVVSKGFNCDGRFNSELYMRVSSYMTFINTVINERPIDATKIKHYSIVKSQDS